MRSLSTCGAAAILIAVSMSVSNVAFAQDGNAQNSLVDGKSALLFEIIGDFDLTSFEGANISFKHHYTDNRAYRIGLGVAVSHENRDEDGSGSRWTETEVSRESITLTALKLYYNDLNKRASFYWGLGPRIGYSHDKDNYDTPAWEDDYSRRYTYDRANAGILGVVGVEWFLARELSLLAQYGTTLDYNWSRNEYEERDSEPDYSNFRNQESSIVKLQADAVRFGLSLYW